METKGNQYLGITIACQTEELILTTEELPNGLWSARIENPRTQLDDREQVGRTEEEAVGELNDYLLSLLEGRPYHPKACIIGSH